MAEPTVPEDPRLKPAREFFVQLRKAAKTIGMYRHQEGRFTDFIRPAHAALRAATASGPLAIKVSSDSFLFGTEPILTEDGGENIPYRFYREGVRHLTLRPGLTEEELKRLTLIMLTQSERTGVELVTQMWEASFEHVDYVVVEGFSVGQLTETQVDAEVDKVVDYLYARLRSADSTDTVAFARVSEADLDLRLEGIEQIRGALFDGLAVSAAFKKKVAAELARDEQQRVPAQLVDLVVTQIVESRFADALRPTELLIQLVDMLLLHEDLSPIGRMADLLTKLGSEDHPGAKLASEVLAGLRERLGEEARLRRLGEALRLNRALDLGAAARYLGQVGPAATSILLEILETIEAPEPRLLVIDALARVGRDRADLFASRLESEKSQTVRDMISIFERGAFPDRAKHIQTALKNSNPLVRTEVLATLGASKSPEVAHRFILTATTDKAPQVRAAAFRALAELSSKLAAQDLLRLPKLPDWEARDPKEKELIHEVMGSTANPEVLKYLASLLQQKKTLLGGKKVVEGKLWAISGLQAMGTISAFKLLQQEVEAKSDAAVLEAARKAMYVVKKKLSGPSSDTIAAVPAEPSVDQRAGELFEAFEQSSQQAALAGAEEKRRLQEQIVNRERAEAAAAAKTQAEQEAEKQRILAEERRVRLSRPPPPPMPASVEIPDDDLEFDPE